MRKSIYIEGFAHGSNPVPAGCINGKLLTTGAIFGTIKETGKVPTGDEILQCHLMFENARRILEAADASWEHVSKMSFYLSPEVSRSLINDKWVEVFPDPESRPSRHVIVTQTLPASMCMQCDMIAWLD